MNVEIRQTDGTLIAELVGDWVLEHPTPRFDRLVNDRPDAGAVRAVGFDATELGSWDSSLLTFLLQGMNYCEAHNLAFKAESLPEEIARLLELARAVPEQ